jgi:hypothetical protein
MGSYIKRQRVDRKEVGAMNHIAEACAELALYRVMVGIDPILAHYSDSALTAMDLELWKLLKGLQASELLTKEAGRNRRTQS